MQNLVESMTTSILTCAENFDIAPIFELYKRAVGISYCSMCCFLFLFIHALKQFQTNGQPVGLCSGEDTDTKPFLVHTFANCGKHGEIIEFLHRVLLAKCVFYMDYRNTAPIGLKADFKPLTGVTKTKDFGKLTASKLDKLLFKSLRILILAELYKLAVLQLIEEVEISCRL